MKQLLLAVCSVLMFQTVNAQSKRDILNGDQTITWLGLDFSQLKFIGSAAQWQDVGEITNSSLRDKYFPAWNDLILNEPKKFKVADAAHRAEVKYATRVTEKANSTLKGNFFSDDPGDFHRLEEDHIRKLVSNYDFGGNKGIGMLFFVESMSKGREQASIWVSFVNMDTKKLLLTHHLDAPAGGIGFRNFWAKSFSVALKETSNNLPEW